MNINWYPGHMKKTRESIIKNLKLVDLVFELRDSRIPISSKNPIIDEILEEKPRIILLNKMDLADPVVNKEWLDYYEKKKQEVILINSLSNRNFKKLYNLSLKVTEEKRKVLKNRGIVSRPLRAMILGIPNVGKSTLINVLSERRSAKVGNRPGVTKSNQWIKAINGKLELLDTPGILWPKFDDNETALNLAYTGAIKDEILDRENLAFKLIEKISSLYPEYLIERYNLSDLDKETIEIMNEIGRNRGCILKKEEIDYTKLSNLILDEFRKGIIGKISLERPRIDE